MYGVACAQDFIKIVACARIQVFGIFCELLIQVVCKYWIRVDCGSFLVPVVSRRASGEYLPEVAFKMSSVLQCDHVHR